jgi:hypothetical protein
MPDDGENGWNVLVAVQRPYGPIAGILAAIGLGGAVGAAVAFALVLVFSRENAWLAHLRGLTELFR